MNKIKLNELVYIEKTGHWAKVVYDGLYTVLVAPANADNSFEEEEFYHAGINEQSVFETKEQAETYIELEKCQPIREDGFPIWDPDMVIAMAKSVK
jgi:hypothetical protein